MPCKIQKVYDGRDVKEVVRDDETFRLISAKTVKGKYSISAKHNDAFILKELYDLGLDVVFNECIDIILEYRTLLQKMIDAGVSARSATAKAKKEAFDKVQAQYIDKLGKDEYLEIFPMIDKSKAKTSKQRSKQQVREVKSTIKKIKDLSKELELPPEVTQPNEDIVTQINKAISEDETLKALEDTRDIKSLKEEKAMLEVPDIELNIDLSLTKLEEVKPYENNESEISTNKMEMPKSEEKLEAKIQKASEEREEEISIKKVKDDVPSILDDDLEKFFSDVDGLF